MGQGPDISNKFQNQRGCLPRSVRTSNPAGSSCRSLLPSGRAHSHPAGLQNLQLSIPTQFTHVDSEPPESTFRIRPDKEQTSSAAVRTESSCSWASCGIDLPD